MDASVLSSAHVLFSPTSEPRPFCVGRRSAGRGVVGGQLWSGGAHGSRLVRDHRTCDRKESSDGTTTRSFAALTPDDDAASMNVVRIRPEKMTPVR